MGRVMAIVSQAWLTMAVIGVSFFRGSITIAKAASLVLLMYSRTGRGNGGRGGFYYLP